MRGEHELFSFASIPVHFGWSVQNVQKVSFLILTLTLQLVITHLGLPFHQPTMYWQVLGFRMLLTLVLASTNWGWPFLRICCITEPVTLSAPPWSHHPPPCPRKVSGPASLSAPTFAPRSLQFILTRQLEHRCYTGSCHSSAPRPPMASQLTRSKSK